MNYEEMWKELLIFIERTEKVIDTLKPSGIIDVMKGIESNEYIRANGDLPF